MRKKLQTSSLLVVFFSMLPVASEAARLENRLSGRVQVVSGTAQGALAALGVAKDAAASVVFAVETTAQGTPAGGFVSYHGAITDWTIDIGSFRAAYDPTSGQNVVNVTDNSGQDPTDAYGASVFMTSTNDLLGFGTNAVMNLAELGSGAISNSGVGQDLSRFDFGSIAVVGAGGAISITLDFRGGGNGNPTRPPTCLPAQILGGGSLLKAAILCRSKFAAGSALDACIDKAEEKFIAKYDAAAAKAGRKGEQCPSNRGGAEAAREILEALEPLGEIILAGANSDSKDDRAYRAALLKAAATAAEGRLKALALNAKKPDPGKLESSLESVESKFAQSVARAGAKAETQGIPLQVSPAELLSAVNAAAETALDIANGS